MGKFLDAASSLEVLEKEEDKVIFHKYDEEGMIDSTRTGVTPYVVGMCNCDYDCGAYKGYIEMRGALGSFFTAAGTGFLPTSQQPSQLTALHWARYRLTGMATFPLSCPQPMLMKVGTSS